MVSCVCGLDMVSVHDRSAGVQHLYLTDQTPLVLYLFKEMLDVSEASLPHTAVYRGHYCKA